MGSSNVGPVDSFAGSSLYPKPAAPLGYPWGVAIAEPPPVLVSYQDVTRGQAYGLAWLDDDLYCLRRDADGVWLHAGLTGNGWILGNGCAMTAPDGFIMLAAEWVLDHMPRNREAMSGCAASLIRCRYQRIGLVARDVVEVSHG